MKIEAYLKKHKPTICPPMAARSLNLALAKRDDSNYQPFLERVQPKTELQQLACAKILAMLKLLGGDKKGTNGDGDYLNELNKARRWFFEPNKDFDAWCDDAGFDPEYVRERARKVEGDRMPIASEHRSEQYNIAEMARYAEIRRWKTRNGKPA